RRGPSKEVGDHEVRSVALGDVEHLRAHLHAGRWHGEGLELVALLDREVLEDRNRLTARRVVEEEEGDLLALEAAVELVLDELHGGGGLRPVRRSDRKDVGVPASVGGGGLPEAG